MKLKGNASREGRTWPGYILGGRLRTSTAVLLIAFCAIWWLYETYEPDQHPEQVPASEVVPPGFIPDPSYTWVPRTDVRRSTPTTTPTTTEETPTPTTSGTPTSSPADSPVPGTPTPPPGPSPEATTAPATTPPPTPEPSAKPGALAPTAPPTGAAPAPVASAR